MPCWQTDSNVLMSKEFYCRALQNSSIGFPVLKLRKEEGFQCYISESNEAFQMISGVGTDNFETKSLSELLPCLQSGFSSVSHLFNNELDSNIETEIHLSNVNKWVNAEIVHVDDQTVLLLLTDITANVGHRIQSEQYQYQYKLIFENAQLGIFRYDDEGVITETIDAFVRIIGSSREKIVGLETLHLPDANIRNAIAKSLLGNPTRVVDDYKAVTSGKTISVSCFFSPMFQSGKVIGGFGIIRDSTERIQIQRELEDNQRSLNNSQVLAKMGSWEALSDSTQVNWSENYYRILDLEPFSMQPDNDVFFSKVHPDDISKFNIDVPEIEANPRTIQFEFRLIRDDGSIKWISNTIDPIIVDGKLVSLKGINIDITELKEAQLNLQQSLQEKDILLSEVHHRVKNNLAIISSLLTLQIDSIADFKHRVLMTESVNRVRSMSLIHELLYRQENFSALKFDEFLQQFVDTVSDSFSDDSMRVTHVIDSEPLQIEIDRAIPLSLITNELLTNAYRHGFKGKSEGRLHIELYHKEGRTHLSVSNDGFGLPDGFTVKNVSSLGLSLVSGLVEQLDGKLSYETVGVMTVFRVVF